MSWTPVACQSLSDTNSPAGFSCQANDTPLLGDKQIFADYAAAATPKQHCSSNKAYNDKENGGLSFDHT